jgi:hypothetical protein
VSNRLFYADEPVALISASSAYSVSVSG